ncbi:hypothetical protein U27_05816 [Candidatus Vecturithrix granuli]|uniref:Porin n=1 Tax=Vecturithrix granuli TaxID=1499967 RepID=A0A081C2N6_VECG1|nr:hypothetical protein U27_05816 [Candidatus Vecturithrix granuli]
MKNRGCFWMFWVFCFWAIWGEEAQAQFMNTISIHGFGGWAYGKTDNENQYLVGNEDGSYDTVNFSLNITATPYERLSLYVQPSYNEGGFEEEDVGLDYAFAEWYFSDKLLLRAGKVKAPFLLFTEVYDVGTIRPFFGLPQGIYRQFSAEAYKGVGLTGSLFPKEGWELQYDLYGGKLEAQPNVFVNTQTFEFFSAIPVINDLVGGRLSVQTPLTGLSTAISALGGNLDFGNLYQSLNDRYVLVGPSLEYASEHWKICSEYLTETSSDKVSIDSIYVDAAYQLTEHWQVAARYEYVDFEIAVSSELQQMPSSLFKHQETALGLNYWFNPNLVFKLSYHIVEGNRFAFPDDIQTYLQRIQTGGFDETTHLVLIGTQFSF